MVAWLRAFGEPQTPAFAQKRRRSTQALPKALGPSNSLVTPSHPDPEPPNPGTTKPWDPPIPFSLKVTHLNLSVRRVTDTKGGGGAIKRATLTCGAEYEYVLASRSFRYSTSTTTTATTKTTSPSRSASRTGNICHTYVDEHTPAWTTCGPIFGTTCLRNSRKTQSSS